MLSYLIQVKFENCVVYVSVERGCVSTKEVLHSWVVFDHGPKCFWNYRKKIKLFRSECL